MRVASPLGQKKETAWVSRVPSSASGHGVFFEALTSGKNLFDPPGLGSNSTAPRLSLRTPILDDPLGVSCWRAAGHEFVVREQIERRQPVVFNRLAKRGDHLCPLLQAYLLSLFLQCLALGQDLL